MEEVHIFESSNDTLLEGHYQDFVQYDDEFQVQFERICPSLSQFKTNLQARELSKEDKKIAQNVCNELAQNVEEIQPHLSKLLDGHSITRINGFTDRLVLYNDENFEIRVHMFKDCAETYIHNHQQSFISYCIQGGYEHSTYNPIGDEGTYYEFIRGTGGSLFGPTPKRGELVCMSASSFQTGQSYFLSGYQYHTVHPEESNTKPVTITFRDKRRINDGASILTLEPTSEGFSEQVAVEINQFEKQEILDKFCEVLVNFSQKYLDKEKTENIVASPRTKQKMNDPRYSRSLFDSRYLRYLHFFNYS